MSRLRVSPRAARLLWGSLAAAIVVLAALLRLDAMTSKYGSVSSPAWARVLTTQGAALGHSLRPDRFRWPAVDRPYVGGDPFSYLGIARGMRSFYQGHVREPVFPALTRVFLWLLADRDIAISFASALGSTLWVLAAYLLGAAAFSRGVGAAAALALAIDYNAIDWAVDGWRDDTFAFTFTLAAWAFVRMARHPTLGTAAAAGVAAAAGCLTRITSLVFIIPAIVWLIVDAPAGGRAARARASAAALLVASVLVAPYLINCAREFGDPLIAVNYHTRYYRHGEGLPSDAPMSASRYVATKIQTRPISALDTATRGLFVWPLEIKGLGLEPWLPGIARVFLITAIAGLVLLLTTTTGRLLLVLLISSLLPYAFTWNIAGGAEWRFTMHVYPLYLVAGAYALRTVIRGAMPFSKRLVAPHTWRWPSPRTSVLLVAGGLSAALALSAYRQLPYLLVKENLEHGGPGTVMAGDRDGPFFVSGWSDVIPHPNVPTRVSVAERAVIRLPLIGARPYDVVVRLDPVSPETQKGFAVLLNGEFVARFGFTWDPQRVGAYRFSVAPEAVRAGSNRMTIIAEAPVPAGAVRDRFPSLDPSGRAGVRFWYVRFEPK